MQRTGVFTSGIVSIGEGHQIALFFTGARHAGENLTEVLKRRAAELPPAKPDVRRPI
jgi:transposase